MSVRIDYSETESGLNTELDDGRSVDVEIAGTPDNHCRVDVRVDRGRHWVFGVNGTVAKLLMVLDENDQQVHEDELPAWIEPMLQRLGLEGVEA